MNDQQLWENLRAGSQDALKSVYDSHIESLLQYGCRFCKDRETVEDCVHDLFIYIWNSREGLSSTDSIQRYLMVALRRRILLQLKGHYRSLYEENIPFEAEISIEAQLILDEETAENQNSIKEAIEQLSERQKEAIYLKYYQKLPYETICEIMNLNYQSARNLIFTGIQTMRKVMTFILLQIILYMS
ncbi:MAG: sigma-70 family RNA polymerase sigma factor [Saprospiraceae bacterium]|nr:sigma-70 family RNA polymerase sigma factor [Saprospiraceae bacterium]